MRSLHTATAQSSHLNNQKKDNDKYHLVSEALSIEYASYAFDSRTHKKPHSGEKSKLLRSTLLPLVTVSGANWRGTLGSKSNECRQKSQKRGTWAILFPTLLTEIGIWEIRFQKEEEIVLSCIEASPQPVFCPPFLRPVQRKRVFLPGCPAGWKWGGRGGRRRGLAEMGERGKEGEGEGGAGEGLATATVTAIQTKTQSRTRQKVTREFNLQI